MLGSVNRLSAVIAAVALLATLTACSGTTDPQPSSPSSTATQARPAPTPSESATDENPSIDDTTARVQDVAGDRVVAATEDYPGEFVIETDIVDPRGDAGSEEAQAALEICEAVQLELDATNIRVQEADGTTFVVLGGAFTECTEA